MPKSYADLLREARAQIREVSPQEVDALPAGAATIVDVREASEWEQGHLPGAQHVSKSYIEQQIEGVAPDRDAPVILYCAGGVRSLFAAQTLAEMGYTDVASMSGGFQGWKSAGLEFDTPVVLTAEQKQRYSRHLLIPEVGAEGQAKPARLEGAAHRRGRARLAGLALPRRGGRRHDRHRRLRHRRRQQPPAPDRPHDRPGRGAQGRIGAEVDQRAQPRGQGRRSTRRCSSRPTSSGSSPATTSSSTGPTRSRPATSSTTRRSRPDIPVVHASVFRFEGQLTTFVPYEGPCYRCLYPTPPPPELAPGCSVAGVLGVVPGHPRHAPGERGAQGPARDRRRRWPAGCSCSMPSRPSSPSSSCGATRTARSAPTRPSRRARRAARSRSMASTSRRRSC